MPPVNKTPTKTLAPTKPEVTQPKLTNRGAAGLLARLTPEQQETVKKQEEVRATKEKKPAKHRIAESLQDMTIDIESPVPDPENARLHPEQNMKAIEESLFLYGQTKPIVVNKRTNIVVAGNGTLAAAKKLGWKDIAVTYVDMTDAEAAAYGLADNRTAELAKWDFEVMKRLDAIITADGGEMVGWKVHELEVLRAAEWVQPSVTEEAPYSGGEGGGDASSDPSIVNFSVEEMEQVGPAVERMKALAGNEEMGQAAALRLICQEWSKAESCGRLEGLDDASTSFSGEDDATSEQ